MGKFNHTKFYILSAILFSSLFCLAESKLVEVGEGYSRTSVNTAVFRQSSLVSNDSLQFIAYYDPEGNVVLGKRKLGSEEWELEITPFKGKVEDAHNIISIGLDGDGFLHLAFNHHGNPLHYSRSSQPLSLIMQPLQSLTGENEDNVTYPEFHSLPDGDLLFVYRDGSSGNGNMILKRYSHKEHKWVTVHDNLIDGQDQRNAYWQMFVDSYGTIHLSWVWRESWLVETNHDMNYARSFDGGETWVKSDITPYHLPISIETAEIAWKIPQNSELINQTGMTADKYGNPYIATYWRDENSDVPQYRLVRHNGKEWISDQIGKRSHPFSLSGGGTKMIPISRPRVVSDGEKAYYIFRDQERGSHVSLAFTDDLASGQWSVTDLTDFSVDAWEPSIDNDLWNRENKLHIFLQTTHQGDGEKLSENDEISSTVYVLEVD